jgi:hypothetical protein
MLLTLCSLHNIEGYSGVLLSCPLKNPVRIDGVWTTNEEWLDAYQVHVRTGYFAGNGSTAKTDIYICFKHDAQRLYVLVDFISDPKVDVGTNNPDSACFHLDTKGDGGDRRQEDDFTAWIKWEDTRKFVLRFDDYNDVTLSPPQGMEAGSSMDASNDPFSSNSHVIYEIAIPRSLFKGPNDPGLLVHVQDHTAVHHLVWQPTIMANLPYERRIMPKTFGRVHFLEKPRAWEYKALASLHPVQIDGKWTTQDEWADAVEEALVCVQGDGIGYMRVKFDEKMLYVLGDFPTDTTTDFFPTSGDPSGAYLSIDTIGDAGEEPKTDDYMLDVRWKTDKPEFTVSGGTGSRWGEFKVPDLSLFAASCQFEGANDPHSKEGHAVYEFAISKSLLGNSTTMRIRLSLWDRGSLTNVHWPPWRSTPNEWGIVRIIPPQLSILTESKSVDVPTGRSVSLPIVLTAVNNFQGQVELRVSGTGQGLTTLIDQTSFAMPLNGTHRVRLTIQVDERASPGSRQLTITATGKGATGQVGVTVNVQLSHTVMETVTGTQTGMPGITTMLGLIAVVLVVIAVVAAMMMSKRRSARQMSTVTA